MQTITKQKLQAAMLRIFEEIEQLGESLIVTDNDRPLLAIRLLAHGGTVDEIFADIRGTVVFHEDPNAPTSDDWEVLNDDEEWGEGFSC